MAKALDTFSSTQFSTLRLASNQVQAHAVELIQASQTGTVEGVKLTRKRYKSPHPPKMITNEMIHSRRLVNEMTTAGSFFFVAQYDQPYMLITI